MKFNFFKRKKEITLDEYKNLLELHDWNYSSSTDMTNHNMLLSLASYSEEFRREFFKAKEKYRPFSGK
jgi:hypothetical protein